MDTQLKFIGICGSLRKESLNRKALIVAQGFFPKEVSFELVEIRDLPLFNQDLEANPPESVVTFRKQIQSANGILFALPEYNYSVSAALKNAIEWGSRPYGSAVLNGKPAAIMGVSSGMMGTGRAQYHLRQIAIQVDMHLLSRPEVLIPFGNDKFAPDGSITDEHTNEKIKKIVEALIAWTKKWS
jgi:chromate reductase